MDDLFQRAEAIGIRRLSIPTPFAVGRVNTYLIEDDPLTLVDSGPNSGTSLDELERQLAHHEHALEDIELILLTHQHIDHIGLVDIVASRSGADVAALDRLVPYMENFSQEAEADDSFAAQVMLRHGIPTDVARALRSVSLAFRGWGSSATVTRVLRDGDGVELAGRTLEVMFRPGHSPTDTVFLDRARRILIGGDHLLKHISSNPLLAREHAGPNRARSLMDYIDSLRRTRELELDLVLGGHGDPIDDHRDLIDERFRLHRRRAEKICALIADRPRSAHELAVALWGNIAVTQAYLTLSEVLGHTDLLAAEGRIVEVEDPGGRVHFEVSSV